MILDDDQQLLVVKVIRERCRSLIFFRNLETFVFCRELQSAEAQSSARVVSLCAETCAGGSTIRAGRLQARMRTTFLRRIDNNHNTLLLLNAANRWLGLSLVRLLKVS